MFLTFWSHLILQRPHPPIMYHVLCVLMCIYSFVLMSFCYRPFKYVTTIRKFRTTEDKIIYDECS
jgi:hypothetical protein